MFRFKTRRKRTYINSRVQGRFLFRVAAYWLTYHAVLWHGLFVYRYAQVRMTTTEATPFTPVSSVYWQFCTDYAPLLMCSVLIMPLFMLDFVRLTHRIVGPLVRSSNALQSLMEGKRVQHIEFRKGDLLTEFQTRLNDFLAFYDEQQHARSPQPARRASIQPMSETQAEVLEAVLTPTAMVAEPASV
ncbi:MAG: hypothetical protein JNG89_09485 [Planctomycetaceae bacterium]|nr:hypothetical protein [Planctomycetaceae bacterium]